MSWVPTDVENQTSRMPSGGALVRCRQKPPWVGGQDVIFNGTSDLKPVGMAEVGMTFLADGEPFPGQWERYKNCR